MVAMEEEEKEPSCSQLSDSFNWDYYLSSDLTELILSHLPIRSIVCAACVCKPWRSIITTLSFSARVSAVKRNHPWFFLYGQNNIFFKNNQAFAFDPESNQWITLPWPTSQEEFAGATSFIGCGGFFFTTTSSTPNKFTFAPVLKDTWRQTSPLRFSRSNPLFGVYSNDEHRSVNKGLERESRRTVPRFIVVGGVRFIGGLVDIEDITPVEIYNSLTDSWDLCPPLPADFRSGNSSQSLSSALFRGKFYVFGIYSGFVSSFDLNTRFWSEVQTLRPPAVMFSYLISCKDQLVLAGLWNAPCGPPSFNLWSIDEKTMEFSEAAIMPSDLLDCLFDSDEDDKFASLKCVGLGNLIYVFNEEHHRNYPACVCEIGNEYGKCSWRRVPSLPEPVNRFHKVISFCSTVSLDSILLGQTNELGPAQTIY